MLIKQRINIIRGEQNTDIWKQKKVGKFSSSEIFKLYENPSKQSKAKAVIAQLKNNLWGVNAQMVDYRPNNDEMTYIGKYLVSAGFCKSRDITAAKKELKSAFSCDFFNLDNLENYDLDENDLLLMRACYAIEWIDILAGSAVGYAKQKALEIIHNELKDDLSKVKIKAIDWGNEYEPVASQYFENKTCKFVDSGEDKVMIVEHLDFESVSSPDDTIDSIVPSEYKCPINKAIHYDHTKIRTAADLLAFDKQKYMQVQHQIFSLHAEYGFWSSFDPRLLRRKSTKHKALHTLKIKLNKKISRQFEKRIRHATVIRDEFVNDFMNITDKGLY